MAVLGGVQTHRQGEAVPHCLLKLCWSATPAAASQQVQLCPGPALALSLCHPLHRETHSKPETNPKSPWTQGSASRKVPQLMLVTPEVLVLLTVLGCFTPQLDSLQDWKKRDKNFKNNIKKFGSMERFLCGKWLPYRRVDVWLCVWMTLCVCKSQLVPELLTHSWTLAMVTKHHHLPASLVLSTWIKSGALWKESFISLAPNLPLFPVYPKGVQTYSERAKVTQPSLLWWALQLPGRHIKSNKY